MDQSLVIDEKDKKSGPAGVPREKKAKRKTKKKAKAKAKAKARLGCNWCQKVLETRKWCSSCKNACYCSEECQKRDWEMHRRECKPAPSFAKEIKFLSSSTEINALLELLEFRLLNYNKKHRGEKCGHITIYQPTSFRSVQQCSKEARGFAVTTFLPRREAEPFNPSNGIRYLATIPAEENKVDWISCVFVLQHRRLFQDKEFKALYADFTREFPLDDFPFGNCLLIYDPILSPNTMDCVSLHTIENISS
jgi:hypothetical protein